MVEGSVSSKKKDNLYLRTGTLHESKESRVGITFSPRGDMEKKDWNVRHHVGTGGEKNRPDLLTQSKCTGVSWVKDCKISKISERKPAIGWGRTTRTQVQVFSRITPLFQDLPRSSTPSRQYPGRTRNKNVGVQYMEIFIE